MSRFWSHKRVALVLSLLLLVSFLSSQVVAGVLSVHFIDVGQGDAILLQSPNGKTMLIDGGDSKNESVRKLLSYISDLDIDTIDIVVATHPHVDHIGGLISVLEQFNVGQVYDSGKIHETNVFYRYLSLIDEKDIPFGILRRGDKVVFDPEVEVLVLHPVGEVGLPNLSVNDCSIVLRVTYGRVHFLFTGDMEAVVEEKLVREGLPIDSDVLKVAHHGSRSSSTPEFLDKVSPSFAIICVGVGNSYGHPNDEVLDRLNERGITTFLTSLHGSVVVETDGEEISVFTERGEHLTTTMWDKHGKLNINTATEAELETLPGIGATLAARIVEYREKHGSFNSIADIMQVSGIGTGRFNQIKDLITVD